jgi:hypothetical protein
MKQYTKFSFCLNKTHFHSLSHYKHEIFCKLIVDENTFLIQFFEVAICAPALIKNISNPKYFILKSKSNSFKFIIFDLISLYYSKDFIQIDETNRKKFLKIGIHFGNIRMIQMS